MEKERIRIGDLLLERKLVRQEDIDTALETQRKTGERFGAALLRLGLISEEGLLAALADLLDTERWDLAANPPTEEALALVPVSECAKHKVIPVAVLDGVLMLAMADVVDVEALDGIAASVEGPVKPVLVSDKLLSEKLAEIAGMGDIGDIVTRALDVVSEWSAREEEDEPITEGDTAPVVSLVNQLLIDAFSMQASDVHIEPCRDRVEVRVRMDGHLHTVREIPSSLLPVVAARIKILAELDIAESRRPQDGRFNVRIEEKSIDVRVSVLPTLYGQRVVMRLLDGSVATRTLEQLGFTEENRALFGDLVSRPYGLVLVTGPTGSGKTTTLYAALNELKDSTKNLMTCENPIEYDVDGVAQSQVNEKAGLTFPLQLRAILRQDPDIVLIGEIRDRETAETAIRASMTGHLVLSTLHCNDAIGALPRLFDMGAEPYLLSTSLAGVVAQRLVRVLCPHCKVESDPTEAEKQAWRNYGQHGGIGSVWRHCGCKRCFGVGYKGRVGVHEILPITPKLARAVAERAPVEVIAATARKYGYHSIQADALLRVSDGQTSFDEARRVVAFDMIEAADERLAA